MSAGWRGRAKTVLVFGGRQDAHGVISRIVAHVRICGKAEGSTACFLC